MVLVEVRGEGEAGAYVIKRLKKQGKGWLLTSDNPSGPTIAADADTVPIARLVRVVRPEDLAPAVGSVLEESELAARFGLDTLAASSGRHGGHPFVFVQPTETAVLLAPDRLLHRPPRLRPGETAFALSRTGDGLWRYLGVARQTADEGEWQIPGVDFARDAPGER